MSLTKFGFKVAYEAEWLRDRPKDAATCFSRQRRAAVTGALVLETRPGTLQVEVAPEDGEPWVGAFEAGPGGLTGLYATPSTTALCVVVRGQGFWVPVLAPSDHEILRSIPIQKVLVVPGEPKLVFVDHTELAAYGPNGLLWKTNALSWDGLKITEVTSSTIRGSAWDSPKNREVPFSVATKDGSCEGGSSPAMYGVEMP